MQGRLCTEAMPVRGRLSWAFRRPAPCLGSFNRLRTSSHQPQCDLVVNVPRPEGPISEGALVWAPAQTPQYLPGGRQLVWALALARVQTAL